MFSLKHDIKVKVTKFCTGWEELNNVHIHIESDKSTIYGMQETKLNATASFKLLVQSDIHYNLV